MILVCCQYLYKFLLIEALLLIEMFKMCRIKNIFAVISAIVVTLCFVNEISAQNSGSLPTNNSLPEVTVAIKPGYPIKAVVAKAGGDVEVNVKIDPTGKVIEADFVKGNELFKETVISSSLKWKFKEINEEAGIRTAHLTFTFYLDDDKDDDKNEAQILEEIKNKHRIKIYRDPVIDCFNDCN